MVSRCLIFKTKFVVFVGLMMFNNSFSQNELKNCIFKGLDYVINNEPELKVNEKEEVVILINFSKELNLYKVVSIPKSVYPSLIGSDQNSPIGAFKRNDFGCILFGDIPNSIQYSTYFHDLEFLAKKDNDLPYQGPPIIVEPTVFTFHSNENCELISAKINDDVFNFYFVD